MGLRDKAVRYRRSIASDRIGDLEDIYEGKTLTRAELLEIKSEFQKKMDGVHQELDRKLIDMQTLFEVGKELNSSFDTASLIQMILFTVMGQFRLSDIAVFLTSGNNLVMKDKKGFDNLATLTSSPELNALLNKRDDFISVKDTISIDVTYKELQLSDASGLIPVKNKDKLIGMILLGRKPKGQPFTAEELSFCGTLASLSGIAIDNARLYEEVKQTVNLLDRKLGELSTLYEISKVINSSGDLDLVLSLVTETIATGFGVKKAVLFLNENGKNIVRKTIGIKKSVIDAEISLLPDEENLMTENRAAFLESSERPKSFDEKIAPYLFVPLIGVQEKVGGLIILSFEKYDMGGENKDLSDLFSIIASQAAPQLAVVKAVNRIKKLMNDPFTPLLERMDLEITKAGEFGVGVVFAMLKLKNYSKYIDLHGAQEASQRFSQMCEDLRSRLPDNATPVRYSLNRLLFIMPGMIESEMDDLKSLILRSALDAFRDSKKIDIGADLLLSSFPSSGSSSIELLNLIE